MRHPLLPALLLALSLACVHAADPDFGPNVVVFDPSTPVADIKAKCDAIFAKQESNQFGSERNAILFKPGTYDVQVNVGFYTQVYGLGRMPDDVSLAKLHCDAKWMNGNATDNFWRGCENLSTGKAGADTMWAVSQAVPLRRIHVIGKLTLFQPNGQPNWASGGYMADSVISGQVIPGSQQQWFSRNSAWDSWSNGVWNMVFLGDTGVPEGTWPQKPYTAIEKTPVMREKPFLTVDASGAYAVCVPGERKDSVGVSWGDNPAPVASIPLSQFYIAMPDKDTAATINAALAKGLNILLTPGIYNTEETIKVTRPDTVILGIGMPTLSPQKGNSALEVADVGGVKIADVLFDAGSANSPVLLQIGEPGSTQSHADDPTMIYDIFCRIGGGAALGVSAAGVIINSNDVIGDHAWIWRADHGNEVGWNSNKSKNGLIVNGNNVTYYGLFVEHFQEFQTLWNGENGRTYFYQSELPYDPPTQDDWKRGAVNGFASYKVADNVKHHEAWGMGVYAFFTNKDVYCDNAIEVPDTSGVKVHHALIVGFKKDSGTKNVINGVGGAVSDKKTSQQVVEYPLDPTATAAAQ